MKYNIIRNSLGNDFKCEKLGKTKMKTVRVVEYTDLDGENHTKDFENASDAVRFFMMVTSERLVKKAALYDKVIEN